MLALLSPDGLEACEVARKVPRARAREHNAQRHTSDPAVQAPIITISSNISQPAARQRPAQHYANHCKFEFQAPPKRATV